MYFLEVIYFQSDKYHGNAPVMASNYKLCLFSVFSYVLSPDVFSVSLCVLPQGTCVLGGITRSCLRT